MNAKLEALLFQSEDLPTLPAVYRKIKDAVDDPESSFEDIARIVRNDPGISARLLRLANSPFYGYPSVVSSVPEALSVIGLQQFKNMALSTCVMGVFKGIDLIDMSDFWRKSIACGLCARIMALELREANSERFFLGGLLHKIGRLLVYVELPEQGAQILERGQRESIPLRTIEKEVVGFDHCEIGGALLEYWNISTDLSELVRHYPRPVLAAQSVRDASLIHIANFVSDALSMGNAGDRFVPEFSEAAWGSSGLSENRLYYIVEELQRQFEEVCHVFLSEPSDSN